MHMPDTVQRVGPFGAPDMTHPSHARISHWKKNKGIRAKKHLDALCPVVCKAAGTVRRAWSVICFTAPASDIRPKASRAYNVLASRCGCMLMADVEQCICWSNAAVVEPEVSRENRHTL